MSLLINVGERVKKLKTGKTTGTISMVAVSALALVACGGGDGGDQGPITIGVVPGWTDQTGTAYLHKQILEDNGYEVEINEFGDLGPLYNGLAQGDIDVFSSAWPERTHESYWDEYGDDIEELGIYYDNAESLLAVPEYSDIESIEDLPDHADELNNQIVGLEAGAGLMEATGDEIMPHYGLDEDFELVESSTAAMTSELGNAIDAGEEIVVPLWTPFWATVAYDVKELEDPDNIYGDPEALYTVSRDGFSDDFPEATEMLEDFTLSEEQFGEMEDIMVNEYDGNDDEAAVEEWLEDNPDVADEMAENLD